MRKLMMVTLGVAALAAGCGGDAGNTGAPASLSTPADAARELGNLGSVEIVNVLAYELAQEGGSPSSTFVANLSSGRIPRLGSLARRSTMQPRDFSTFSSCTPAGTYANDQSKSRAFQFFSVTETVNYSTASFANPCVVSNDNSTSTQALSFDGNVEGGAAAADNNGLSYAYGVYGAQTTPFTLQETITNNSSQQQTGFGLALLGPLEASSDSSDEEVIKSTLNGSLSTSSGGTTKTMQFVLGSNGTPLELDVSDGSSTENLSLSGSYAFTSSVQGCTGATITYSTTSPVVLTSGDSDTTTATGGTLKLSSGGNAVTYTFNSDGSASLSFADGSTGALTADQVSAAFSSASSIITGGSTSTSGC